MQARGTDRHINSLLSLFNKLIAEVIGGDLINVHLK